jgi:hypothetical protein
MTSVKINWNPNKGDIIARLMNSLAEGTGWEISKEPNPKADINYFALYIQVGQSPNVVHQLKKTAAYFSHYEVQRKDKMGLWNIAASKVDIRTTVAAQYVDMLKKTGETHLVYPPPIDDIFRVPRRKPRIGVSGFVHPGGRKGEHLVKRLYEEMGNEWDIVATGQGWNIPDVKMRDYKDLPAFYQSLDVFLCTSITEGIPMPPLEALACGVPIVVPYGVGILDELRGYSSLISHYLANDYDDMLSELEMMTAQYSAQSIVQDFTQEAWCKAHKEAFGMGDIAIRTNTIENHELPDLIQAVANAYTPIENKMPKNLIKKQKPVPKAGAICVAYGVPARDCARRLIPSWQTHMSDYPIALVSDEPINVIETLPSVFIEHSDDDIGARSVKTDLYNVAPQEWKHVLYLDADTEIIADVSQLFRWLKSGFDFVICTNPSAHATIENGKRDDNQDEMEETIDLLGSGDLFQMNGGVFGFTRNTRTKKLMNAWHSEWRRYGGRDQFALLRALHNNPVKLLVLGNEWNTIIRSGVDLSVEDSAGILHFPMTGRRWEGLIYGKLDSKEAWDRVAKWKSENL